MNEPITLQKKSLSPAAGKILYALLFLLLIPLGQWYWAQLLDAQLQFPVPKIPAAGLSLMLSGVALMAWSMYALKKFGKGLPMNAYPPALLVKQGPYRWVRHPIYWGYGLVMTGAAWYTGSGAGVRIVVPVSILAMMALVLGYEGIYLKERFKGQDRSVVLDIPVSDDRRPYAHKRLTALFWTLPLLILSLILLRHLTTPFPGSENPPRPPLAAGEAVFRILALCYTFFPALLLPTNQKLRQWTLSMIIGLSAFDFRALFWPQAGNGMGIPPFPTPLVLLLISGSYWIAVFPKRSMFPVLIGTGVLTGSLFMNTIPVADLFIDSSIFLLARYYKEVWQLIRGMAERLANSWREWTVGPVRIFSHSIYVGLGSFAGIFVCGLLAGKGYAWALLIFAIIVIICAAVWAQVIEGSDQLKRPFGYYGAVAGILVAGTVLKGMGYEIWRLIAAISVLMPWVQAAGRLRCLVNGCCHGSVTENQLLGIRYDHPRSRVCTISGLKGKYLHPTPVYSILWLSIVGLLLIRLWQLGYGYTFLFGLYLILTSLGRFVEEAYRGEVQTPVWNKLRLYQWVALLVLIAGILFTLIPMPQKILPPEFGWEIVVAAGLGGLFTFFAMGVDFPRSNARFSRLV